MTAKSDMLVRRLGGAGVFLAALLTYWITAERTISWWDCPEYVANAMLLEPGHPPGNPAWMLAAHIATLFAPEPQNAALLVNLTSGLFTALAVWLLFDILWMGLRYAKPESGTLSVAAGAAVGSLCFAWCDTAWYSAVEAEVYAMSVCFTALQVWLALIWAHRGDDRWLVLLAYVTGLSLGIHQLNLLSLPAVALIICYRSWPGGSLRRAWASMGISIIAIAGVLFGLMPGLPWLLGRFELWMVNGLHLPYNSGTAAGAIVLLLAAIGLLAVVNRYGGRCVRTVSWSVAMLCLGYCIYGIIMIRGYANPPMNEGWPGDIFSFRAYLERDQYGSRPILRGPTPDSKPLQEERISPTGEATYMRYALKRGKPQYARANNLYNLKPRSGLLSAGDSAFNRRAMESSGPAYVITDYTFSRRTAPELDMWLSRIYSSEASDVEAYESWLGMSRDNMVEVEASEAVDSLGNAVGKIGSDGKRHKRKARRPTYGQQLRMLATYQVSYMYLRYLMWNFAGRQNSTDAQGEADNGNFITGIDAVDSAMLGPVDKMPDEIWSGNPGHNRYFMLPLLLGIIGIFALIQSGRRGGRMCSVVAALFLFTGVAIAIYLNQTPGEARERDYSFVGSFLAYAMWIGAGAWWIAEAAGRVKWGRCVAALALAGVPLLMLRQNYDDHDRSQRTAARDFAIATLQGLDRDAIIFVTGDNYTFPLWYVQEVEGIRRDVRVVSTGYLLTPWYALQQIIPTSEGRAVPMTAEASGLAYGAMTLCRIGSGKGTDAIEALRALYASAWGSDMARLPSAELLIPGRGDSLTISLGSGGSVLTQDKLLAADIIATNAAEGWQRPIYWGIGTSPDKMLGLAAHTRPEGLAVRLVPDSDARMDAGRMARFLLGMDYGGLGRKGVYTDVPTQKYVHKLRQMSVDAARAALDSGNPGLALRLLNNMERRMPGDAVAYNTLTYDMQPRNMRVDAALLYGELSEKLHAPGLLRYARKLALAAAERGMRFRAYYNSLPGRLRNVVTNERRLEAEDAYRAVDACLRLGIPERELMSRPWMRGYPLAQERGKWERMQTVRRLLWHVGSSAAYPDSLLHRYEEQGGGMEELSAYPALQTLISKRK